MVFTEPEKWRNPVMLRLFRYYFYPAGMMIIALLLFVFMGCSMGHLTHGGSLKDAMEKASNQHEGDRVVK
jgi:hypothetical protein